MGNGNSIVNLGDLTKPATVLIGKISEAIGGVFIAVLEIVCRAASFSPRGFVVQADARIP